MARVLVDRESRVEYRSRLHFAISHAVDDVMKTYMDEGGLWAAMEASFLPQTIALNYLVELRRKKTYASDLFWQER